MKHTNGIAFLLIVIVLLLAPPAPAASVVNTVQGVEIRLDLSPTEIVVGEPVYLTARITNRNAPLRVGNFAASFYLAEGNDLAITIQAPGELPARYLGPEEPGVYSKVEVGLDTGESQTYPITILYDAKSPNGYVFGKPGEYFVSVTLQHSILRDVVKTKTVLPPTRILVKAAEGRAAEAFKLLEDKQIARALHEAVITEPKALAAIVRVADEFPDTAYAAQALYVAGATSLNGERAEIEAGIRRFLKFLERFPGHPRAGDAIFNVALAFDRLGERETARAWVYFLKDRVPDHRLLRVENPLAAKYYYGMLESAAKRRWWLYTTPWDFTVKPEDQ
jgi:hypothetical protein